MSFCECAALGFGSESHQIRALNVRTVIGWIYGVVCVGRAHGISLNLFQVFQYPDHLLITWSAFVSHTKNATIGD